MELTQKQKIEAAIRENPTPRNLGTWLQYQEKELEYKLRKLPNDKDFRFTQGQLAVLEELRELLSKAIS